jgi:hypothetical protein
LRKRAVSRFCGGALVACGVLVAGCASEGPARHDQAVTLKPGSLETEGIAFLTPSTVTGQEQDKQAVALIFADTLSRERPKVRVVTLAETLTAVNRADLADAYRQMFDDYRDSGLFPADALRRVAAATGTRYVGQLNLQRFEQVSKTRFSIPLIGLRFLETQIGHVRLFFQVWDTSTGTIAWEAVQERSITSERVQEAPILQRTLIRAAAEDLIEQLP